MAELDRKHEAIGGMRLTYEAPVMRHFTARLEPIGARVTA